jgi:23S rRNA (guanosine2251-2'-O)-methyltransferase
MDILYGLHPVAECLKARRRRVGKIWVADRDRLAELKRESGGALPVQPDLASKDFIAHRTATAHHQGVAAEVGEYPYAEWEDLLEGPPAPLLVALDNLTDPQNVGAILRSALCAGATGVTLRKHHAAQITPAVVKASAGASEHLRVALVPNHSMFLEKAADAGLLRVALAMEGESIWEADVDWRSGLALVVGAEGKGLSRLVSEHCDRAVRIPMGGGFDSLNASVAASLALFEAARHRR